MRATCPHCGAEADGFTAVEPGEHVPSEGDFAVCAYCGAVNVYRADRMLREAAPRELRSFEALLDQLRAAKPSPH